ncbi:septal ring lytic transglycosylase RlpA family protein [Acidisphaera sp. S103]|uniref:septal ring lytic transglycosylase RlpA family protein n=1 Tax=Acidisphaera sp. S103 TaxID=1747223 RepID=UPI00131BF924|nr:septal ring lytic transglycosylase RlpA family protein [Acidisphaera sp. S103]
MIKWRTALVAWWLSGAVCAAFAGPLPAQAPHANQEAEKLDRLPPLPAGRPGHIDQSGRKEKGRASYYANCFDDRKMADGRRLNPDMNMAASKTLPLGSVVKVTNLENGRTAMVQIEDRGPYVRGRVVDLARRAANQLDIGRQGVVPVVIRPITLPRPDGSVVLGAGAAEVSPQEVRRAVEVTKELTAQKAA